jgi:hypothetical protein
MIRSLFLFIFAALVFSQCRPKTNPDNASAAVNLDSLQTQFKALDDSLQTSWQVMIASDDDKLRLVGQLLNEIGKGCPHDKAIHAELVREHQGLPAKRYASPDAMTSSQIDQYDAATDTLLNDLRSFYQNVPTQKCCSGCQATLDEVERLHGEVIMFRIRYDNHAKEYNALVTQQKEKLAALKPEFKTLKTKQLFSLMQ